MAAHKSRTDLSDITANPTAMERFWTRVRVAAPDQCWLWTGARNRGGYGVCGVGHKRTALVHRVAYAACVGAIPEGALLLHPCDSPACCNPRHLRVGTALENARDCVSRGRQCRGAKNGRAKLNEARVRALLELAAQGWPRKALAAAFGVSARQVKSIVGGVNWKHVARPVAMR